MNYYIICKKILGEKIFEELIKKIAKDLEEKIDREIVIEKFVEILEINIRIIMIIALCKVLKLDKSEVAERLHIEKTQKFMVEEDVVKMEEKYKYYIKLLVVKLDIKD